MFREYRVGYSQNFDAATQLGTDWQWTSCTDIDRAEIFWVQWTESHFNKKSMSAMVILRVEWDLETGLSTCNIMKKQQHKLTPTIHYNKKDGVAPSPKYKTVTLSQGQLVGNLGSYYTDAPNSVPVQPVEPTNMQMINAFLTHLNT